MADLLDAGVLDDVVQHGRHKALVVHVHVGEDAGDREGMGDVGFAAAALLAVVRLLGVVVGAPHQRALLRIQIGAQRSVKGVYGLHGSRPFSQRPGWEPRAGQIRSLR